MLKIIAKIFSGIIMVEELFFRSLAFVFITCKKYVDSHNFIK